MFKFVVFLQAYASGCDVVILLSGFTRVQIIPGSLYGYKEVSCIDCCDSDGKVQSTATCTLSLSLILF